MGNIIVIVIIVVIAFFALKSSLKHFKGQGGCCGGSCDIKPENKKLEGKKIEGKIVSIEGMHCDHCKNSVEKSINAIEGAVAKVNLGKKIAVVSMDRHIDDSLLISAVEKAGFKVVSIEEEK